MLVSLLAILIGALAGVLIPGAWQLLASFQNQLSIHNAWADGFPFVATMMPSVAAGVVILLVLFLSRSHRSADAFTYFISDLHFNEGRRKLRYSLFHGLCSFILLVGGGVVGVEGLALEFLSALGGKLGSMAQLAPSQVRTLTACGVAASIAAFWGQPLVGILFTIELLHGWGSLAATVGPLALTAFVAAAIGQALTMSDGLLPNSLDTDGGLSLALRGELFNTGGPNLLLGLILVAVAAAVLAGFLIWLYRKTDESIHSVFATRRSTDFSALETIVRILLWAGSTGLVAFHFPEILGGGVEFVKGIVSGMFPWQLIAIGLILRILLGVLSYCTLGSMGLMMPILVLGAAMGGAMAVPIGSILGISGSALAVLGMGALFAAAFGTPIAATALVYGSAAGLVTENAFFLFAVLATNFLAHYICELWQEERFATMGLYRHGIRFRGGMCFNTLSSIKVSDAMLSWVAPIPLESSMADAYKLLMESRFLRLPVVDQDGILKGMISLRDFYSLEAWRKLESGAQVQQLLGIHEFIKQVQNFVRPEMSLEAALGEMGDEELAIVTELNTEKYVGILVKTDIENLYNKEVVKKAFRR